MKKIVIGIGIALLLAGIIFRWWYDREVYYPSGFISDFPNSGTYKINPDKILVDLENGRTNVFEQAFDLDTSTLAPLNSGSFIWEQSDYLVIANVFHQYVWNEPLYEWQVYQIDFGRGCNDNQVGFDAGNVIAYKKNLEQPTRYIVHFLGIYPLKGVVLWGEGDFRKPLFGWKSVNLEDLKVSADKALQIAEAQGGEAFRLQVKNLCTTSVSLKPNPGNYDEWLVYYSDKGGVKNFLMWIDPSSGEHTSFNQTP
ncbi:MAG: hypothetical protein IT314_15545 [Anaerolineales bacterium]|nr:hypothetical protein [Anaerolineales bacterium]